MGTRTRSAVAQQLTSQQDHTQLLVSSPMLHADAAGRGVAPVLGPGLRWRERGTFPGMKFKGSNH